MRNFLLGFKLARREMRNGLSGFYVFLSCLILGTFTITAILSLSAGLKDSLRHDGRTILGGDIALRTIHKPASMEQILYLRKEIGPTTITTETRAMVRREDETDAMLIELKAVDPFYPIYGTVRIQDANRQEITDKPLQDFILPNKADESDGWGAAVEPSILARLNLKLGDYIYIGNKRFQIRTLIKSEPDRLGSQRFGFAPRIIISSYIFDETGLSKAGSQVYYDHKIIAPYIKTIADLEETQLKFKNAFQKLIGRDAIL